MDTLNKLEEAIDDQIAELFNLAEEVRRSKYDLRLRSNVDFARQLQRWWRSHLRKRAKQGFVIKRLTLDCKRMPSSSYRKLHYREALAYVLRTTSLKCKEPVRGVARSWVEGLTLCTWHYSEVSDQEWKEALPAIEDNIRALYRAGQLSSAKWTTQGYRVGTVGGSEAAAELPPGWTEEYDPLGQRSYFWNADTHTSQWQRPTPRPPSPTWPRDFRGAQSEFARALAHRARAIGSRTTHSSP